LVAFLLPLTPTSLCLVLAMQPPKSGMSEQAKPSRLSLATSLISMPFSESGQPSFATALTSDSSQTETLSRPGPTMHPASYSTSEPTESSIPTLTTIFSAVSLPWHSPPLVESCLLVMMITTVMSGIPSKEKGLVFCLGMIIESVVWESVGMVSRSAPEAGTVYSRLVVPFYYGQG